MARHGLNLEPTEADLGSEMEGREVWGRLKNGGVVALIAGPVNSRRLSVMFVVPAVLVLLPVSRSFGWSYLERLGFVVGIGVVVFSALGLYIRNERRKAAAAGVAPTGIAAYPESHPTAGPPQ